MHGVGFSEYSRVTNCHTQSPACLGICPDHSRTPEATLGRLPAESATLHQVACGTLAGMHLQTPNLSAAESIKHEQVGTVLSIRGHSAGSYAGIVWEGILAEFPNIEGMTVLAAMALPPSFLPNRLDLCIQGLFGAGKSKSMVILILALIELDEERKLKILFLCKKNSGTRSFSDLLLWLDLLEGVLPQLRYQPP